MADQTPALPIGIEADFVEASLAVEELQEALEILANEPEPEPIQYKWLPAYEFIRNLPNAINAHSPYHSLTLQLLEDIGNDTSRLGYFQVLEATYSRAIQLDRLNQHSALVSRICSSIRDEGSDQGQLAEDLQKLYAALGYSWVELAKAIAG